ncbi:MAG: phosphate ABC transporter ATP-binding protein [Clostridium sp.]
MDKLIEINNLNVTVDNKQILSNINFPIYKGKITSIIGPSGCGKSTLLKVINKSLSYGNASGEVLLNGENINNLTREKVAGKVGLISQTPAVFPFSIYKNISYALEYFKNKSKGEIESIVIEKLKAVGLFHEVKDRLKSDARSLSGGQKQRLCIARSLAVEPLLILLDEPCSALDIRNTSIIEELLKELKLDYTILIVTHNLAQARRISDYTAFIESGNLIEFGDTEELFNSPKCRETREYISYM